MMRQDQRWRRLLEVTDLTVDTHPPHAVGLLVHRICGIIEGLYGEAVAVHHGHRVVTLDEDYTRVFLNSCYEQGDAPKTIRMADGRMLRSHATSCVPPLLAQIPRDGRLHVVVVDGIRMLRAGDRRIAHQMHDLDPWRSEVKLHEFNVDGAAAEIALADDIEFARIFSQVINHRKSLAA